MKTKPIYLQDPYKKTHTSKIIDVIDYGDNKKGIILEETIFYPFGGGQPTDQGKLKLSNGDELKIGEVVIKNGEINHFASIGSVSIGDNVFMEIDWKRRYKNMAVHTAGHIIDFALQKLGYVPEKVSPLKASHGSKPEIIYEGELPASAEDELKKEINDILSSKAVFSWKFQSLEEIKKMAKYLQPGLPNNKPLRSLTLEGYGTVADGGTIMKNANEISEITINSIHVKDGETVIKYSASPKEEKEKKESAKKTLQSSSNSKELLEYQSQLQTVLQTAQKESTESKFTKDELRNKYLGRKSELTNLVRSVKDLPQEDRPTAGKLANEIKNQIESLISKIEFKDSKASTKLDVTLPGKRPPLGHLHLTTQAIREVESIFKRMGFYRVRYPEVEWDYYAFSALNFPDDHPARDEWETLFIDKEPIHDTLGKRLLTPHTSSGQVREMEKRKPPIRMVNISRVYRRQMSVRHLMNFFQFEGLVVDKHITIGHLKGIIEFFLQEFLGSEIKYRIRPYHFRFTEPSIEVDVFLGKENKMTKEGWLEIGGAGMVHPKVLEAGGIDPKKYSGYAFGFGVERNKLSVGGINLEDIRTLYQTDVRFLKQF